MYNVCYDCFGFMVYNDFYVGNIFFYYFSDVWSFIFEFYFIDFGFVILLFLVFIVDENDFLFLEFGNLFVWDIFCLLRVVDKLFVIWFEEYWVFFYLGGDLIGIVYRLFLDLDCWF